MKTAYTMRNSGRQGKRYRFTYSLIDYSGIRHLLQRSRDARANISQYHLEMCSLRYLGRRGRIGRSIEVKDGLLEGSNSLQSPAALGRELVSLSVSLDSLHSLHTLRKSQPDDALNFRTKCTNLQENMFIHIIVYGN